MKSIEDIAAALQGYDPQALSVQQVGEFLQQLVHAVRDTEVLPLFDALDRVLAQDVMSPINVPPHNNSAMDGYAFDGAQLSDQSLHLHVVGTALAGRAWQGQLQAGECLKIMTGAILPDGMDTVVPQEFTQSAGNDQIVIPAGVLKRGDNSRQMGEDLRQGLPALLQGTLLRPAALGLLASIGIPTVTVYRRLKVAYFSTGDEILSLGETLREGAVYDSNRYTVFGLLTRLGCDVIDMGVVRDDPTCLLYTSDAADD